MKQGYILTGLQCQTCQVQLNINPTVCMSLPDLQKIAAQVHRDTKLICAKPLLIVAYNPCLVSNEIVNAAEKRKQPSALVGANGNGLALDQ